MTKTLTRADLAQKLTKEHGLNKFVAKAVVNGFFESVCTALENGQQVKLSGFGNFDLRDKKQRAGRNPKTGEEFPIPARRVVTFYSGKMLKTRTSNPQRIMRHQAY